MLSIAVSLFDFAPCKPLPSVTTPTLTTSPSSKAFVACVVPWAINTTSSGLMLYSSMILCNT